MKTSAFLAATGLAFSPCTAFTATPVQDATLELVRQQVKPDQQAMAAAAVENDATSSGNTVELPDYTIAEGFRDRELLEIVNAQLRYNAAAELSWTHGGYYYSAPWDNAEVQLGVWTSYHTGKHIGNSGDFKVPHVNLVSLNW